MAPGPSRSSCAAPWMNASAGWSWAPALISSSRYYPQHLSKHCARLRFSQDNTMIEPIDADPNAILTINDLKTWFFLESGTVKAVDGVSLTLMRNQTLGLVGESGCGKSITAMPIMRLIKERTEERRVGKERYAMCAGK